MATANSTGATMSYEDFVQNMTTDLYELSYQIKATNALLMQDESWENSNEFLGVGYLLEGISKRCDQLAADMSDIGGEYDAKEVANV